MELGIYSFAEINPNRATGAPGSAGQRLRDLVEEIELADQVGLDVFGVGEHHRPDFAVSSPAVVLAAAAERTKNIRLSSAVAVQRSWPAAARSSSRSRSSATTLRSTTTCSPRSSGCCSSFARRSA